MCYFLFNSNCLPWKSQDQAVKKERAVYNYKNIFFAGAFDESVSKYVPTFLKAVREMVNRECSPKPIDYSAGPFRFKAHVKRHPFSGGSPKPLADLQVIRPANEVKPYKAAARDEDNKKPQVNSANSGQRMEHTEEEENTDSSSSASEISKKRKRWNTRTSCLPEKHVGDNQPSSAGEPLGPTRQNQRVPLARTKGVPLARTKGVPLAEAKGSHSAEPEGSHSPEAKASHSAEPEGPTLQNQGVPGGTNELSNAFQPPEVERDVAEPEVQGDIAVQIEGLPSGLVVGSAVAVKRKKKICAVVVEMSAEEITVQFGTGKRFPYRRYL
uniref:Uncharacterized protein n=1 Tax=Ditylenchus dipsaci TaxID=166011 RepID=A0A915DSR9_9BILA